MRKSALQPRSRKTPTGGRMIAKLEANFSNTPRRPQRTLNDVHDLENRRSASSNSLQTKEQAGHTLQMSEPVKAIANEYGGGSVKVGGWGLRGR